MPLWEKAICLRRRRQLFGWPVRPWGRRRFAIRRLWAGTWGIVHRLRTACRHFLALGAEVELIFGRDIRIIPLADLLRQIPLYPAGTLIRGFRIPQTGWLSDFAKLGRREALAISHLNVAVGIEREGPRASEPYKRVAVAGVFRQAVAALLPQGGLEG